MWRTVGHCHVLRQGSVNKEYVRLVEYQALFGLKKRGGEGEEFYDATVICVYAYQLLAMSGVAIDLAQCG